MFWEMILCPRRMRAHTQVRPCGERRSEGSTIAALKKPGVPDRYAGFLFGERVPFAYLLLQLAQLVGHLQAVKYHLGIDGMGLYIPVALHGFLGNLHQFFIGHVGYT